MGNYGETMGEVVVRMVGNGQGGMGLSVHDGMALGHGGRVCRRWEVRERLQGRSIGRILERGGGGGCLSSLIFLSFSIEGYKLLPKERSGHMTSLPTPPPPRVLARGAGGAGGGVIQRVIKAKVKIKE